MDVGWIKLHRKTLDNPIACKDADHLAIWIYLLLSATHKEIPGSFNGKKITLQPGQLITGRKSISEHLNIHESKVQRVLNCFENEQQIEQQTGNKNRLITLVSWCEYQSGEQQDERQVNNKRTTDEQQMNNKVNTNKKSLRNKEPKKERTKDLKNEYAPFIFLTEEEHIKLTELLGEDERDSYFLRFASWISGQTKRVQESRSAYLSILNWHREDKKKVVQIQNRGQSNYQRTVSELQRIRNEAEAEMREQGRSHHAN